MGSSLILVQLNSFVIWRPFIATRWANLSSGTCTMSLSSSDVEGGGPRQKHREVVGYIRLSAVAAVQCSCQLQHLFNARPRPMHHSLHFHHRAGHVRGQHAGCWQGRDRGVGHQGSSAITWQCALISGRSVDPSVV
jgi:hypothetical protein